MWSEKARTEQQQNKKTKKKKTMTLTEYGVSARVQISYIVIPKAHTSLSSEYFRSSMHSGAHHRLRHQQHEHWDEKKPKTKLQNALDFIQWLIYCIHEFSIPIKRDYKTKMCNKTEKKNLQRHNAAFTAIVVVRCCCVSRHPKVRHLGGELTVQEHVARRNISMHEPTCCKINKPFSDTNHKSDLLELCDIIAVLLQIRLETSMLHKLLANRGTSISNR